MSFCRILLNGLLLILVINERADSYSLGQQKAGASLSRRAAFRRITLPFCAAAVAVTTSVDSSSALDMDAFIQKELDSETCNEKLDPKCKPKLSADESLCRFGSPSKRTGEACDRAGMTTVRAGAAVDAYGSIDRGTFEKCKPYYIDGERGTLLLQYKCENRK
mmetsp:Transcript_3045/g.3592  ORF Transcript_3045/g.3592 Transcript_3045/m.3592 type:complete len:163 (-) Transcript_3045:87-575(-)